MYDLKFDNSSLNMIPKAQAQKKKNRKFSLKLRLLCRGQYQESEKAIHGKEK